MFWKLPLLVAAVIAPAISSQATAPSPESTAGCPVAITNTLGNLELRRGLKQILQGQVRASTGRPNSTCLGVALSFSRH